MTEKQLTHTSKLLSLVLRHQPETIGLTLDSAGWASVPHLLERLAAHGTRLTMEELETVVATNSKKRFAFNEDHTAIRASQGHSIDVELGLAQQEPPEYLYHGTIAAFVEPIRNEGLKKMSRQHVHLSADVPTAVKVAERRGEAVILTIRSRDMHTSGLPFYLSDNDVWLTDAVPPEFISF